MAGTDHLQRRDGRYSVRKRVPENLRAQIGKREIWVSLGTSDLKQANLRKHAVLHKINADFEERRRRLSPSDADLQALARAYYLRSLEEDSAARLDDGSAHRQFNAVFAYSAEGVAALKDHLAIGETVLVQDAAAHWLAESGYTLAPESPDFKRFCHFLLRAEVEYRERQRERDAGTFIGKPNEAFLNADHAGADRRASKSLSDLLPLFHAERQNTTAATREEQTTVVEVFEDFCGYKKPVSEISKQDLLAFKSALLKSPANRTQRFPGASFHDAIRKNDAREKPYGTLHPKTINGKYLGHVKAILNWAASEGLITASPATGVRVEPGKTKRRARDSFTGEELKLIFQSALFRAEANRDAKFWAIVIAAYSGLRASEIAQLETGDIQTIDGILCFHLTEAESAEDATTQKTLKTGDSGRRHIPIHEELIKVGLVAHRDAVAKRGSGRLFRDWKANTKKDYSQTVPRWFNRTFLPTVCIERSQLSFHSFRHTFKEAARNGGVPTDVSDFLTGHVPQGVSAGYGRSHGVKILAKWLADIRYDGIDLSHLYIRS